jgi:hypothetical protein
MFEISEISMTPQEQVIQLALREFQKVLRENLEYEWDQHHGHPPKCAYIEQKAYSTEPWQAGVALHAWSVTPDSIESLAFPAGPPTKPKIDGMFYDTLVGFFGITQNFACISLNWQTGPRFGRGCVCSIERSADGSIMFGSPKPTWMS